LKYSSSRRGCSKEKIHSHSSQLQQDINSNKVFKDKTEGRKKEPEELKNNDTDTKIST